MSLNKIIDFQVARLRALHKTVSQICDGQHCESADMPIVQDELMASDDAALVIRLVLQICRRNGRNYHNLPHFVRVALDDMCADGNSACRLVRSWLRGEVLGDQSPARHQAHAAFGDRVFRHNRFWRPGSPWLLRADDRRRAKLATLLIELEDNV